MRADCTQKQKSLLQPGSPVNVKLIRRAFELSDTLIFISAPGHLGKIYDLTLNSGTNGKATSFKGQTTAGISPGYYELSDATMDIFGPDFPIKYRFTDICGILLRMGLRLILAPRSK